MWLEWAWMRVWLSFWGYSSLPYCIKKSSSPHLGQSSPQSTLRLQHARQPLCQCRHSGYKKNMQSSLSLSVMKLHHHDTDLKFFICQRLFCFVRAHILFKTTEDVYNSASQCGACAGPKGQISIVSRAISKLLILSLQWCFCQKFKFVGNK